MENYIQYMPEKKNRFRKRWQIPALFALLFSLFFISLAGTSLQKQNRVADSVLRLHILANSNLPSDQSLKLSVRNRLLQEFSFLFESQPNADAAAQCAERLAPRIATVCKDELLKQGCLSPVSVQVEDARFPTKRYGRVRLPAGRYRAVKIRIGTGGGQNWWCVLYPPLCLLGDTVEADEKTLLALRQSVSPEEYALLTNTENIRIQMQFRVLEVLEKWFSK